MNKEEYDKALDVHLGKTQIPEEEEHNVGKLKQIKEKIKNALGVQKKEEKAAS